MQRERSQDRALALEHIEADVARLRLEAACPEEPPAMTAELPVEAAIAAHRKTVRALRSRR